MPFCSKCGAEVPENVSFCSKCGNALQGKQIRTQSEQPENLSLWGYYVKCLKNYANFKGRARRREFWGFILFDTIITLLFAIVGSSLDAAILDIGLDDNEGVFVVVFNMLYWLASFLPMLAVSVRRMHDTGREGIGETGILAINSLIVNVVQNFIGTDEIINSESQARWVIIMFLWLLISTVVVIWCLCKDSQPDSIENEYGPCPKISAGNYG